MKTALIFGFRDDAAGSRRHAFEVTREIVSSLFPFDYVTVVDSGHPSYNRAATRNLGVRQAEAEGCDLLVLCDADSIPEKAPLAAAIEGAYADGLIHHSFNEVWMLMPKMTHRIRNTLLEQLRNRTIHRGGPSRGGIWVCRPDVWWLSGGQDPRILYYGAEDRAHLAATSTLVGESVIHEGVLLCAYHDRQLDACEDWDYDDVALMTRYHDALGDVVAMRALTEEWKND